jgi:hypothetical protein
MTLKARSMEAHDAPACVSILNHIIALGGTTAYEDPMTEAAFDAEYRLGAAVSNIVLEGDRIVDFQAGFEVETGIYSLGTFAAHPLRGPGPQFLKRPKKIVRPWVASRCSPELLRITQAVWLFIQRWALSILNMCRMR